ncbi:MAG: DUF4905 domain-containing protein [Melioribacteraceae bacterium]|nr:DUF4905 domain-containing protein [Melioribacteraceae bacterium]MCF8265568.1 DUF4905 domain-containing protein [Melioribacteraceae bacterium]MCF8430954.1 DUF4905 domain-containing protein [Melioribacteraceae bacterium]
MQLKYKFTNSKQIFRILISGNDNLLIETRDVQNKIASFHCLDVATGKPIFRDLELEEKYWVGVDAFYNNIILFHKFEQPTLPKHKGIFAYDITSKNFIWQNENDSFLFLLENKIYCFKQRFEGREFYTLDIQTGSVLDELGTDFERINELRNQSIEQEDFSNYFYPENYLQIDLESQAEEVIKTIMQKNSIFGDLEILQMENNLFINYHHKFQGDRLNNTFTAFDLSKMKFVYTDIINTNLNAFAPDSFFVYKSTLLLLKEKTELMAFEI